MDWDQIMRQWKGFGTNAKETLEWLIHEVLREKPKTKDRETAAPKEAQHMKHFEDMH